METTIDEPAHDEHVEDLDIEYIPELGERLLYASPQRFYQVAEGWRDLGPFIEAEALVGTFVLEHTAPDMGGWRSEAWMQEHHPAALAAWKAGDTRVAQQGARRRLAVAELERAAENLQIDAHRQEPGFDWEAAFALVLDKLHNFNVALDPIDEEPR